MLLKECSWIGKNGFDLENERVVRLDLKIVRGDCDDTVLEIQLYNHTVTIPLQNEDDINIYLKLASIFALDDNDMKREITLNDFKNQPCRVIVNCDGDVVGIGHFMKNNFMAVCPFALEYTYLDGTSQKISYCKGSTFSL